MFCCIRQRDLFEVEGVGSSKGFLLFDILRSHLTPQHRADIEAVDDFLRSMPESSGGKRRLGQRKSCQSGVLTRGRSERALAARILVRPYSGLEYGAGSSFSAAVSGEGIFPVSRKARPARL